MWLYQWWFIQTCSSRAFSHNNLVHFKGKVLTKWYDLQIRWKVYKLYEGSIRLLFHFRNENLNWNHDLWLYHWWLTEIRLECKVLYCNFDTLKPLFTDKNIIQDYIKYENFDNNSVQVSYHLKKKNLYLLYCSKLYYKRMLLRRFLFKLCAHLEI